MSALTCTPEQARAIRHTAGPAQVLAGPGSGKTFTTVHRIRHLITDEGVDPAHILVITFTKTAALEMQQRFFTLMEGERPPVWFGTFHAVFYHILKQSAQYRGYTIITEAEKRKLIRQIVRMHRQLIYIQEEDIEEILSAISRAKADIGEKSAEIQKMTPEDFAFLMAEYQSYLREFRQFDFDDMMLLCLKMFRQDPACLRRWQAQFRYILVDEFQDISPVQYEIVRLLAAPGDNLFIVGDDDQSIYGFRGADPENMIRFTADYPQTEQILLGVNYRCHEEIVAAAGRVIAENTKRIAKDIRAAHREGEGLKLYSCKDEEALHKTLAEKLAEEQKSGNLSRCAMICRTNFACGLWAQVLHEAGIPYVMKEKPKNRFSHFVIQDILAYLSLGQGEFLRRHFLRIMNRPLRYLKRDSMPREKVERDQMLMWYRDTPAMQERVRRLFRDLDNLHGRKLHLQVHYIRKIIGYENFLREKYGSGRAQELVRIAEEFETFARQFVTFDEMKLYIENYTEQLQKMEGKTEEKAEERTKGKTGEKAEERTEGKTGEKAEERTKGKTEEKTEGIALMTMHASKGLEFDTVYLPDCNEGQIPQAKSVTAEEIEEERRMFYVAMTRAKRKLCLFYHKGRTGKDGPSRFLQPLS